jgi:hypothetical protein
LRPGKCLFLYHYQIHPILGFLHARIQTWFPFAIQICLNGREWLACQMQAAGLHYLRQDNCFPWIANWTKAQHLMDRQLKTRWPKRLNGIARQLHPIPAETFRKYPASYYWSTYQHEWALDVIFHHAADLRRFYPRWLNHAMTTFSSPDVMRFLGKHTNLSGQLHQSFSGEVVSDFKRRAEGVRVKHSVNRNSVKLYHKAYTPQGSVLRAEATFHNGDDFRVYRRKEGDRKGPRAWRRLRRGVADWNNPGNGVAVECAPSVLWARTGRCYRPSTTASSQSTASAIVISAPSSFPRPPLTISCSAAAPPGSLANSAYCVLTPSSPKSPALTAIKSLPLVARPS